MLFKLFLKAQYQGIIDVVSQYVPKNLRQYYADKLMYLTVCEQYGVQAEV